MIPFNVAELFRSAAITAYITDERPPATSDETLMVAYPEFKRAVEYAYNQGRLEGAQQQREGTLIKLLELKEYLQR